MTTLNNTEPPVLFLTPDELAARWKITPMTLRRWRKAGKIKAHKMGKGVRFSVGEIGRFESENYGLPEGSSNLPA